MRKLLLLVLTLTLTLFSSCSLFTLTRGLDEMMNLHIGEVDLTAVEDGDHRGSFAFERWSNTVEVTVHNHAITAIRIIKDVKFAKAEVSSAVFEQVKTRQSIQIDAISGSTVTTKAYLKSIESALQPYIQED